MVGSSLGNGMERDLHGPALLGLAEGKGKDWKRRIQIRDGG